MSWYVDARLPNPGKSLFDSDSPSPADTIRAMVVEGWLPPWHEWFGEEAVRDVLPDAELRQEFINELRPIPPDLFEEPIPGPADWSEKSVGYIHFATYTSLKSGQREIWAGQQSVWRASACTCSSIRRPWPMLSRRCFYYSSFSRKFIGTAADDSSVNLLSPLPTPVLLPTEYAVRS